MKLKLAVVYEQTPNNYCAYLPDLPGCIGAAKAWGEIQELIREAATLYIEAMAENGDLLPEKPMSLEEAIAYHSEPLEEYVIESLAEYGAAAPTLSTTFQMVEIEVELPQAATGI